MTFPLALLKSTFFFLRHGAFGVIVGLWGFVWRDWMGGSGCGWVVIRLAGY